MQKKAEAGWTPELMIVTERPEYMSYERYREKRNQQNAAIKKHLKGKRVLTLPKIKEHTVIKTQ